MLAVAYRSDSSHQTRTNHQQTWKLAMPHRPLRRLVSPAGLLLALLCFGLPFVAVSCGTTTVEYTGLDLVVGGTPTVTEKNAIDSTPGMPIPVQPLAVLTVLSIAGGIAVVALPRVPVLTRAVVASLAALLLMVNEIVTYQRIVHELRTSADLRIPAGQAADMVRMRSGFWFALALLLGVATYNVVEVVRRTTVRSQ